MEFKAISDVIVRRLEGRCRFRIGTRGEQTAGQQGPDSALYSVPSRLTGLFQLAWTNSN